MPVFVSFMGKKAIKRQVFGNSRTAGAAFTSPKVGSKNMKIKKVGTYAINPCII
jgi:hypothetical protein